MQFYRLWIYACNGLLGASSVIFTVFSILLLTDFRISLLGGLEWYHPTLLYGCVSLLLQCGVVQTIGCVGVRRYHPNLLTAFWILLLLLTIGDMAMGIVGVFNLNRVSEAIPVNVLENEFLTKYSIDPEFTRNWDQVQSEDRCCGVHGPSDFAKIFPSEFLQQVQHQNHSVDNNDSVLGFSLPESCCTFIYVHENSSWVESPMAPPPSSSVAEITLKKTRVVYETGCHEGLIAWLKYISGVFLALGFSVVVFVKLCILFLLPYEIGEMIKKIHKMEEEDNPQISARNIRHSKHPLLSNNTHRASAVTAGGGLALAKSNFSGKGSHGQGYSSSSIKFASGRHSSTAAV